MRYVESLLASTAGYQLPLPQVQPQRTASAPAPPADSQPSCSACGCHGHPVSPSLPSLPSWSPVATSSASSAAMDAERARSPDPSTSAPAADGYGGHGSGLYCGASVPCQQHAASPTQHTVQLPFTSQCEHHMLPFHGTMAITILPGAMGGTLAVHELQHLVAVFTRRLQIQERITHQVADAVFKLSGAAGVLVICDASHMCMVARGVESHGGHTTTLASRGVFESRPELRRQGLQAWRREGR